MAGSSMSKVETPDAKDAYQVFYCANCDGGSIERNELRGRTRYFLFLSAAVDAIKAVDPEAKVVTKQLQSYPIKVTIKAPDDTVLFEKDQRHLFRKYAEWQAESIKEIGAAVRKWKGSE